MKKLILLLMMAALFTGLATAQAAPQDSSADAGILPGNPLYGLEQAVEAAEIQIAGIIGGPDMKAKALANNAEERLAEAKVLAENNKTKSVEKMVEEYENTINQSQTLVNSGKDRKLSEKIRNISNKNIEVLERVKKKVPEEAQKGIQNAIDGAKKRGKPGNTGKADKGRNKKLTDRRGQAEGVPE